MDEHRNATRIRELFAAFRQANLAVITDTISENAIWHFPGRRGRLAGDHEGREAIVAFLVNVQQLTGNTFHLDLIDVVANEDNAVALFRGHASRNGKTLDNPT